MTTRGVLVLFLILAAIIVAVFLHVALSTRRPREVDHGAANRLRRSFFLGLMALLVVFLALTLPRMPYPAEAGAPDQVVQVSSRQYAFALGDQAVSSLEEWDASNPSQEVEVKAGSTVEFRVTTIDVNHGFSLYSPEGDLIAQTQAMPGYLNRLRVRFDRPGTYIVLCLEYCGLGHHRMRGVVEVK